jgi:hypothetical protein
MLRLTMRAQGPDSVLIIGDPNDPIGAIVLLEVRKDYVEIGIIGPKQRMAVHRLQAAARIVGGVEEMKNIILRLNNGAAFCIPRRRLKKGSKTSSSLRTKQGRSYGSAAKQPRHNARHCKQ